MRIPGVSGQARSGSQRNEFGEFLHGHPITEGLAWSAIEASLNSHEVFFGEFREVGALGHVLAK